MLLGTFIIVCVVVGVVLFLINRFIPMEPSVKQILNIGVVIILLLWVLTAVLGLDVFNIRVGR